jgi:hypothetical protein
MARQGFAYQTQGARIDDVGDTAVTGSADRVFQPTGITQRFNQCATSRVNVALITMGKIFAGPCIERTRNRAVARLKKRPAGVMMICHFSTLFLMHVP